MVCQFHPIDLPHRPVSAQALDVLYDCLLLLHGPEPQESAVRGPLGSLGLHAALCQMALLWAVISRLSLTVNCLHGLELGVAWSSLPAEKGSMEVYGEYWRACFTVGGSVALERIWLWFVPFLPSPFMLCFWVNEDA